MKSWRCWLLGHKWKFIFFTYGGDPWLEKFCEHCGKWSMNKR